MHYFPGLWKLNLDTTTYRLVTVIREQMGDSLPWDLTIHPVVLKHLFIGTNGSGYLRTSFPFKHNYWS